jgi:hypothetical protein
MAATMEAGTKEWAELNRLPPLQRGMTSLALESDYVREIRARPATLADVAASSPVSSLLDWVEGHVRELPPDRSAGGCAGKL